MRMTALFAGAVALVVYTFAGYPAIVAAWARLRPRPVRADPAFRPPVSLIISAYNEEAEIVPRLENAKRSDYPKDLLEVIVVADGSDDRTAELAGSIGGVRVLHEPERRGKLAAIARAADAATGDVLVFSDANNRYTTGTILALTAPFADPGVGVVAGRKAIDDGTGRGLDRAEGLYWRYESKIKTWESAIGSTVGAAGEIVAFRREAFRPPPVGTMNEDLVQAVAAAADGWRVVYAPKAVSLERASLTVEDEAIRRSRLVAGRFQALVALMPGLVRRNPRLAWQLVSHKGLRPVVPWALVVIAATNILLLRRRRWARATFLLQAVFYGAAAAGWARERSGRRSRILYLPYYFCRMNVAALRGVRDFVAGRREHVWARVRRG
jgi:cellulose synthase/poly-beta-1,6-N-acetylglucosamine synthase-like glycosyltransferase